MLYPLLCCSCRVLEVLVVLVVLVWRYFVLSVPSAVKV